MNRKVDSNRTTLEMLFDLKEAILAIRNSRLMVNMIPVHEIYELFIELVDTLHFVRKESNQLFGFRNPLIETDPEPFSPVKFNVGGLLTLKVKDGVMPLSKLESDILYNIQTDLIQVRDLIKESFVLSTKKEIKRQRPLGASWFTQDIEILEGFSIKTYSSLPREERSKFIRYWANQNSMFNVPKKGKSNKRKRKAKFFAKEARYKSTK